MYILGITCYGHDSSAAIVKDGILLTAVEEERFNRQKHSYVFPVNSIRHCLEVAGIGLGDIDHVGYYLRPWIAYWPMFKHFWSYFPKSLNLVFDRWTAKEKNDYIPYGPLTDPMAVLNVPNELRKTFGQDGKAKFKFHFIEHHLCHQASSFLISPFEEAASLSIDGCGEWTTTMMGHGKGNTIDILGSVQAPHSLGTFYNSVCEFLGFNFLTGPGKVMGLASYGDPDRYYEHFKDMIILKDDGTFEINFKWFDFHITRTSRRYSPHFVSVFGEPRSKEAPLSQREMDMAAGLQKALEQSCFHILRHLQRRTGSRNLCLSGGVALNSVMNHKILEEGIFDQVFIQAAASDSGCSIGSCFHIWNILLGQPRRFVFDTACVGTGFTDEQLRQAIEERGLTYTTLDDPAPEAARIIAGGQILGWFQGRSEFGPRALGSRSILTAPFPAEMKDVLNARVKHREGFRPFAPVVLEEKVSEWFETQAPSPFMLLVPMVREDKRDKIPAVTHVDGTGRVQTVTKERNGPYYDLIVEFEKLTGVPVILNTSFNIRGMPIVDSPKDALDCFLNTAIDVLVMGPFIVRKDASTKQA